MLRGKRAKRAMWERSVRRVDLVGSLWRQGREWLVEVAGEWVFVSVWERGVYAPHEWFAWRVPGGVWVNVRSGVSLMNKYIAAARAAGKKTKAAGAALDPVLSRERPAITAFMTETDGGEGRVRETSALMIAVGDDGLRVGLKDDDMGGWCWRSGATLQAALDALEVALASGEARFGGSGRRASSKKR